MNNKLYELCQSELFKKTIADTIHSFRQIFFKYNYSLSNIDIRLSKIRNNPIEIKNGKQINGSALNLVGGHIAYFFDSILVDEIEKTVQSEDFVSDFFDYLNVDMNGKLDIKISENDLSWKDLFYYIKFDITIIKEEEKIQTFMIVAVDEILSMYF